MEDITLEELRQALNYEPDTGIFTWRKSPVNRAKIGTMAGTTTPKGYVRIVINRKPCFAHRLAWLYVHGVWPKQQVDHINGNPADNRIANLRDCTNQENNQNRRVVRGISKYMGVSFHKRTSTWTAKIKQNGKTKNLGHFATEDEAAEAYQEAKRIYHPTAPINQEAA